MQDISTTLRGRIGSEPMMKHVKGDVCVTTFRLAITKWRFTSDARTGNASYVEDGAYWYTVETWDTLASNVFRSCRKGDPVVVVARPVPNGWIDGNGQIRSSIVYRASSVGHDLARGTSQFTKNGVHANVAAPDQGTHILPDEAAPSQSEPTPHAPTGAVGVEFSVLPALEEHERSEEHTSDPGRSSSSCFDYSALEGGHADATKNDAFEPLDGDADEPPDAA